MTEKELRDLLTRVSERDLAGLRLDEDLAQALDLDSLTALRMLAAVEKYCGVRFPDDRLGEFRTLDQILTFIKQGGAS